MSTPPDNRINQAQLARVCGVSRPAIAKLVSKGIVQLDDDGLVDRDAALTAIAAHADLSQAASRNTIAARIAAGEIRLSDGSAATPPAPPPASAPAPVSAPAPPSAPSGDPGSEITSFQLARALREKFAALNERLDYETKRGALIPRDVVERVVFGLARQAQEALRAIPDRLATQLAAESCPVACHRLLDAEVRQVIDQIASADPLPPPVE